eukprot:CAMPEP_0175552142 /NCGR_PEP_ID=MMETSP0096-20121207/32684_1 /TAXON_ID=311494 /ORGANISM="Alexandrium monilatum, Strain CCMP3105" /LENGTH=61 /DNA_ID=CAMNT_0016855205 /DNA_START=271 /DNA_END=453 /DNA_ORIENTATION=-
MSMALAMAAFAPSMSLMLIPTTIFAERTNLETSMVAETVNLQGSLLQSKWPQLFENLGQNV